MNSQQQQVTQQRAIVEYTVGEEKVKLTPTIVQEYLTGGAVITMPEFKMFTSLCKARGLNPFLKEAYIIKYGTNPAQIVVGKDAILKRAILNTDFDGREQGIIALDEEGNTIEKNGTFLKANEILVGGWAKVYRKNWSKPVYITVAISEVEGRKRDGNLNSNWSKQPATMVEKVALVRALREAFVEDLGGMYDADEMNVDNNHEYIEPGEDEIINQPEDNIQEAVIIESDDKPQDTINIKDI